MAFSRSTLRQPSSRLIALALVAAGTTVVANAQTNSGTFYWGGGDSHVWSELWEGASGSVAKPNWNTIWARLLFGINKQANPVYDNDGYSYNNVDNRLKMDSLYFYNQAWTLDGESLLFNLPNGGANNISVQASCPSLLLNTDIELESPFTTTNLSLDVQAATSTMTVTGLIRGNGAIYKSGLGTVVLKREHTYNKGTYIDAGTLIDQNPFGGYGNNSTLVFDIASGRTVGETSFVYGGGTFVKNGIGSLALGSSADETGVFKNYTGATIVNDGALTVKGALNSSSYTVNERGQLIFQIADNRTYVNALKGKGVFYKTGAGTLTLTSSISEIADLIIDGGRVIETNPSGKGNRWVRGGNLQFNIGSDLTFEGTIVSSGSFTKDGAGTLTLAGDDTYFGGTTVLNGRLIDLKPEYNYTVNGALEFRTTDVRTFTGLIAGNGSFTKSGSGTLTLDRSGGNTYTGGTTVNEGRLIERRPHGSYVTNAELEFNLPIAYGSGPISGRGSFTLSGNSIYFLGQPNTYAGTTTVNGGLLWGLASNVLPTTTALTVNAGGTYQMAAGTTQIVGSLAGAGRVIGDGTLVVNGGASTTFSGVYSGAGSLFKGSGGTLTLTGANTYTGGTTVSSGRLVDRNPQGDYVTNATLEFANDADSAYGRTIDGTGTFVKSGSGTLDFTGSVKGGVATQIAGGTLKANAGGLYGDVAGAAGTTFQTTGTFVGAFSGAGSLRVADGRLTMAKAPTNTGGVSLADGELRIEAPGGFGGGLAVDARSRFRNASAGTLEVAGTSLLQGEVTTGGVATTVFAGPVSGAGRFTGAGTVEFRGGYSPGNSPASVSFEGDLRLGSGNDLTMELGGAVLGAGYDHLSVLRNLSFRGKLDVRTLGGFSPTLGQSFDLFDFASATGTFASVSLPALGGGLRWDTSALYTTGAIRTQAVPEPATLAVLAVGGLGLLRRRKRA